MSASDWANVVMAGMAVLTGGITLYEFIESRSKKKKPAKKKARKIRLMLNRIRGRRRRGTKPGNKDQTDSQ